MLITPITHRAHKYPEFVPYHADLHSYGLSQTAVVVYGYYELAIKQKGNLSVVGSLAVECPSRKVAEDLNLSPAQVKRARKELINAGLIGTIKQSWGRPSLTVVYTYTLDDDATPPAGAVPDPIKTTKVDGTTAPASVPSTKEALEASPAKKADHTPAAPPEGQDKGTSVTSSEGASEGAPTHRLGVIGDPSDGAPVASHEGAAATSHSSICGIPSLCREREKHSLQAYGRYGNVMLTDEEYQDIQAKLGEYVGEYVDHFSSRLNEKRYRCSDHHRAILSWWESDKDTWVAPRHTTSQHQSPEPGQPGNSFDTDDFFGEALRRSFGDELVDQIRQGQDCT